MVDYLDFRTPAPHQVNVECIDSNQGPEGQGESIEVFFYDSLLEEIPPSYEGTWLRAMGMIWRFEECIQ